MQRIAFFIYGMVCYLMFLAVFLYMAAFVGGIGLPRTIDGPAVEGSVFAAAAINVLLILLFAAQHSVMARPGFKHWWKSIVPTPIERSTYVLLSCVVLIVLMWQWRAMPTVVWHVDHPAARAVLWTLFAAGWLSVPLVSLLINHFDLFGTRQVWLYLRNQAYTHLPFRTPMVYNRIRHPLYVGWMVAFWTTPTMTVGHLLFAAGMSLYMLVAIRFEERDLIRYHGPVYEAYRQRVPMLIPTPGRVVGDVRELEGQSATA